MAGSFCAEPQSQDIHRIQAEYPGMASLESLTEASPTPSRDSLAEWLLASLINSHKEGPGASREGVKGWLEVSINPLQEEGPEASDLNVQEWLEASVQGIQDLQKSLLEFHTPCIEMIPPPPEGIL